METGFYTFGAALLTALVTYLGIKKAGQKEKEDINIARTGQAIESWQELAESNKGHWDKCEERVIELQEKTEKMQQQINSQSVDMLKLQGQVYTLQLQIHGRISLDAERDGGNDQDRN